MLKAVVFDGNVDCKEVPEPSRPGETVLSVQRAGICGTDLAIASGDYRVKTPLILGHELYGTVKKAPADRKDLLGKRAATEITVACGECYYCRAGMKSHCANGAALGIHRDGGFAEFVSTPADNIHLVPDAITDEEAVFIEPLAACVQLVKVGQIASGSTCAVVGPGRMGLLVLQLLKQTSPRLLVTLGRPGRKLEMARKMGVPAFEVGETDVALKMTDGAGFDNVVETTGTPGGLEQALRLVKPRGTLHLKSTHGLPVQLDVTKVVVDEIRVQGSRCGPFEEAIGLLAEGKVEVREMITDRFPLEKCGEAFGRARSSTSIKTIFEI